MSKKKTAQTEAEEFQEKIMEMEKSCQRKQAIMERAHGEHTTAKTAYTKSVDTMRETIQAYSKPLPLLDGQGGKGKKEATTTTASTKKTVAKKTAKKKAKRGGLDHKAVLGATGQGKNGK